MIISIGELLWDNFGTNRVMGGAPLNVAYHLHMFGERVDIISRVGIDRAGDEALDTLNRQGLPTEHIQRDRHLPTGMVNVSIDAKGDAAYDICGPAAWDNIELVRHVNKEYCKKKYCIVFGSLAQRSIASRGVIRSLWKHAAHLFYDVNLRPPHTSRVIVEESLNSADIVKVNEEELVEISAWLCNKPVGRQDYIDMAKEILKVYNLTALVVTRGGNGAFCIDGDNAYEDAGLPITPVDTVGAGDAFFAAMITGYLKGRNWPEILRQSNRYGSFIATQNGATPKLSAAICSKLHEFQGLSPYLTNL